MNQTYTYYLSAALLLFTSHFNYAIDLFGKTFLHPRSQNLNSARHLAGIKNLLYHEHHSPIFTITPVYSHSFRPYRIAEYFFGTEFISITGSQVANRQPDQLLADHFGLSPAFDSTIQLRPSTRNGIIDMSYYGSYSCYYLHLHMPYAWICNQIEILEDTHNNGADIPFPALYFSQDAIASPVRSFAQAIQEGVQVGDLHHKLQFGRIGCPQTKKGLADVMLHIGWYAIQKRWSHLDFYLHIVIPTGNKPTGQYLFEPIVGNGHHVELGAGFSGHVILWEKDFEQTLGLYFMLQASHLFSTTQHRSFDLCQQGFASRYMLLKEFNESNVYIKNLVPTVNITTLPCRAHNSVEFEFLCMAGYQYNCWGVDFGYSAWLRSKDVIRLKTDQLNGSGAQYGLKGIQNVRTLLDVDNTTQSNATIVGTETPIADVPSPQYIQISDINIKSAANPQTFTHKLFGNIEYLFMNGCSTQPFVGIGGEVEFESIRRREFTQSNKNCISQWALWFKCGLSFH